MNPDIKQLLTELLHDLQIPIQYVWPDEEESGQMSMCYCPDPDDVDKLLTVIDGQKWSEKIHKLLKKYE